MNDKPKDITGKVYGRLTVESFIKIHEKTGNAVWKCKCTCGNYTEVKASSLKSGITKSCGCLRLEFLRKSRNYKEEDSSYKFRYYGYIVGARRRNLDWKISFEEFKYLVSQICYYCDSEPENYNKFLKKNKNRAVNAPYSMERINKAWIKFNGIDRIDNNEGYVEGNVRSCCKMCNRMKSSMTAEVFVSHANKIKMATLKK